MAFRRRPLTTSATREIVLTVDPDVAEANTAEALAAYRESRDLTALTVPGTATRFRVRALTLDERIAATDVGGGDGTRRPFAMLAAVARAGVVGVVEAGEEMTIGAFLDRVAFDQLAVILGEIGWAILSLSSLDAAGKA